jgi:hypothetical protein
MWRRQAHGSSRGMPVVQVQRGVLTIRQAQGPDVLPLLAAKLTLSAEHPLISHGLARM